MVRDDAREALVAGQTHRAGTDHRVEVSAKPKADVVQPRGREQPPLLIPAEAHALRGPGGLLCHPAAVCVPSGRGQHL